MKYCTNCGATVVKCIPEGDDRERYCCEQCHAIHYHNPKLVVGCIPEWQGKILLCLRNIEPRRDRWTLPAGYLENGETVHQGARRETYEETRAEIVDLHPYLLADLVSINQLYLMFRCRLTQPSFQPTAESREVRLFNETEIPWEKIAFPVISHTLERYLSDRANGNFPFRNESVNPSYSVST